MSTTPFWNHTLEELISEVCGKEDPTDLELELMRRVEALDYEREYWRERAGGSDVVDVKNYVVGESLVDA